jgi:hypothetical protein
LQRLSRVLLAATELAAGVFKATEIVIKISQETVSIATSVAATGMLQGEMVKLSRNTQLAQVFVNHSQFVPQDKLARSWGGRCASHQSQTLVQIRCGLAIFAAVSTYPSLLF